ncbi:MAG: TetR/AcrR family transcriptional regulator [Sphingomonas bacterium]|uniref:TetR/AcrR family transcriptional regulator n=1 Tax=Sphingomonas bacterium TaxID=1895847 RepID=UPI00262677DB|nr:TetR/AcrR family transcriptional regulator [Sphingomonas bacterium]MDB5704523.1 TetR/AcrR family transcriptional regulator [Sphingomonas bacterium]
MVERETGTSDGRRRRSETSRDKIVEAMLALVAEGQITPSADQVATRAEVGLRSVFRHFKDMESLYAEMTGRLAGQYAMWLVPYDSADWRGQMAETIARRLTTYERLMPFKRAADAHRHESPAIQANYSGTLAMMRTRLKSILPEEIAAEEQVFETVDLLLSFETWQRLRMEQGLSVDTATAIIKAQVDRLIEPRS